MADNRIGNPSDPDEEAERVRKAYENVKNWGSKYGAEFSGGVSMQYGSGRKYEVPIGDRQIAQKVVSRPLPPKEEVPALPVAVTTFVSGPLKITLSPDPAKRKRSWFNWLFSIFGDRT